MRRGDVVMVAASGHYGKPRPAVIILADSLLNGHASVALCQLASVVSEFEDFRAVIAPSPENGLRLRSDIMVDKPVTVRRSRIGTIIGRLSDEDVQRLNAALAFALGLSD